MADRKLVLAIQMQVAQAVKEMEGLRSQFKKFSGDSGSLKKEIFSAQLAFDIFKKGIGFFVDVFKGAIDEFIKAEAVTKQTEAVLKSTGYAAGMSAGAVKGLADSLSSVTTFEDDVIQKTENLLLTFTKVGKDTFPLATETILDMSVALGKSTDTIALQVGKMLQSADAMGQARKMGVSFTDEQIRLGKELEATGRMSEYQSLVLGELQKEFGGSARAARETFGGSLKALQNSVGNVQESIGGYIAAVGKPFVDQMIKSADAVKDWMESAEGMETLSNIFSTVAGVAAVVWKIFENIGKILKDVWDAVMTPIAEAWKTLTDNGQKAIPVFQIIGKIFDVVGFVLGTVARGIGALITGLGNTVNTIIKTGELIDKFQKWMGGAATWQSVEQAAAGVGDAWQKGVADGIAAQKDMERFFVDSMSKIFSGTSEFGNQLAEAMGTTAEAVRTGLLKTQESAGVISKQIIEDTKNSGKANVQLQEKWHEELLQMSESELETKIRQLRQEADLYLTVAEDKEAVEKWFQTEKEKLEAEGLKNSEENYKKWAEAVVNGVGNMFSSLGEALATGEDAWGAFAKAGIEAIAGLIDALGQEFFLKALAAAAEAIFFPPKWAEAAAWTAAGVAAKLAAGIVRGWAGSFAQGGSFLTNGPTAMAVGDNPGGVERVTVTPVSSFGSNDGGVVIEQPVIIVIDGTPIYRGLLRATKSGIALVDARAVVK